MPNHVDTNLIVTGDKKQLAKFIQNHIVIDKNANIGDGEGECKIDFDTIIPCPKDLYDFEEMNNVLHTVDEDKDIEEVKNSNLSEKEKKNKIIQIVFSSMLIKKNVKAYGHATAYDFHVNEWGTKWGAYDCYINHSGKDRFEMNYNTAWSPAVPIFQKLATMYPKLTFENVCLDEGWMFAGRFVCSNKDYDENFVNSNEDIALFCNEYMGGNYVKCEKHGCWYNEDTGDGCYECENQEENA